MSDALAAFRPARPLVLAAMLGVSLAMVGCEDPKAKQAQVIRDAAALVDRLTAAGQQVDPTVSGRTKALNEIISTVQPLAAEKGGPMAGPASSIIARAKGTLAEMAALEAVEAEQQALRVIAGVRSALDVYTRNAAAGASGAGDAAKDTASLEARRQTLQGELAALTAEANRLNEEVNKREKEAERLLGQAKTKREEAAGVRAAASKLSAQEQLESLKRSTATVREADELDRQASFLRAEAAALQPEISLTQQRIEGTRKGIEGVEAAVKSIREREVASKATSAASREAAGKAAADIAQGLEALNTLRAGAVTQKVDAAKRQFSEAIAAAKAAGPLANKVSLASLEHGLADVLVRRARGLAAQEEVLNLLAAATPALPTAADLKKAAADAGAARTAALDEAKAALEAAEQAYAAGGGGGDLQTQLEKVAASLKAIREGDYSGTKPSAAPAAGGAASAGGGGTTAAAAESAVVAEVRAAARAYLEASVNGDNAAVNAMSKFADDSERRISEVSVSLMKAVFRLNGACKAKFGKSLAQVANGAAGPLQQLVDVSELSGDWADKFTITMKGDQAAELRLAEMQGADMDAVKEGGKWLFMGTAEMRQQMATAAPMMMPMLKAMSGAIEAVAADVESGKITEASAVMAAIQAKVMQGMGGPGGMGGMGGPGGG
ncbi:MAG: hypothetical protein IOD15_15140 [Phycisphaerales bacterium]|nr:hypothetical protein [Phycisphaerales bacterium]